MVPCMKPSGSKLTEVDVWFAKHPTTGSLYAAVAKHDEPPHSPSLLVQDLSTFIRTTKKQATVVQVGICDYEMIRFM
jgi:hypothetical protein